MSNIYIQEPPTSGKVVMKTTVGDIDLELWAKEAPKACRNFVQLCMENYYDNTIFHRIIKGFIAQGGDPTGTGEGGESVYGQPFKDEFHTRLRFCRRGLLAMANAGKDDNGSQFFFTFGSTPELQNKHTIFGKVTGETVYNMLKLEEALVDEDDRPLYPPKILKTEVLSNPFPDIEPRITTKKSEEVKDSTKAKKAGVKNFNLLSFGEEAEEDEEESVILNKQFSGKGKSAHDHLSDPKLSSQPAVEPAGPPSKKLKEDRSSDWESDEDVKTSEELDPKSGPGRPSGFGFELTFRLVKERNEMTPPTWPANVMQQLAKYVFNSGNMLLPGDHVSWHAPLNNGNGRITQILMGRDPQLPASISTPHGDVSFVQIVGVTSEELQAAQHWNGLGLVNLLKSSRGCGPWLVTDMRRIRSVMEDDPSIAEKIQTGIEKEGSNLSGVSAKCWWVQVNSDKSTEKYRETKNESDEEDEDVKPIIKSERLSPCEQDTSFSNENFIKVLPGLHLTFNLEAGSLLPLAIKGRVMHGRHFTFKSILSHTAITIVAPSVTGTLVSREKPYVVQGPWLQVLLPEDLSEKMAQEFQILNSPHQIQLPKTFSWPEHKLVITVVND